MKRLLLSVACLALQAQAQVGERVALDGLGSLAFDRTEVTIGQFERYARATGYPIQYQWTLIEGVNDSPEELDGIVRLLSGKYALMNMIPFNSVPGLPYQRPSWERAAEIARTLHRRGILTKLRQSAGQDVDGGCGQLRARDVVQRVKLVRGAAPVPAETGSWVTSKH